MTSHGQITLNGENVPLDAPAAVSDLVERWGYDGRIAVAVNGTIVPKSKHGETTVAPGDAVEIVAPMKGG